MKQYMSLKHYFKNLKIKLSYIAKSNITLTFYLDQKYLVLLEDNFLLDKVN